MPLQALLFPLNESRLIKASNVVYKFKIRGGSSYSQDEVKGGNCFSQELEEIIRTVLGNLEILQPFSSTHFNVFPYKKPWKGVSELMCQHFERNLRVYPCILILFLEKNMQNDEGKQAEEKIISPQSKRCKRDSPLEEAILKDLIKDLEAESKVSVVRLRPTSLHLGQVFRNDPVNTKGTKVFDEPKQISGVSTVSSTPGEVRSGTNQDMGEEEDDKERENADLAPETPVKPGILSRLASHIFPFSLFFRDP